MNEWSKSDIETIRNMLKDMSEEELYQAVEDVQLLASMNQNKIVFSQHNTVQ